jgi:hypothetical protein
MQLKNTDVLKVNAWIAISQDEETCTGVQPVPDEFKTQKNTSYLKKD